MEIKDDENLKNDYSGVVLDFYTIEQLAQRFGCGVPHLRNQIRNGNLTGVTVGQRLIFSAANVQAFLKSLEKLPDASKKKSDKMKSKK